MNLSSTGRRLRPRRNVVNRRNGANVPRRERAPRTSGKRGADQRSAGAGAFPFRPTTCRRWTGPSPLPPTASSSSATSPASWSSIKRSPIFIPMSPMSRSGDRGGFRRWRIWCTHGRRRPRREMRSAGVAGGFRQSTNCAMRGGLRDRASAELRSRPQSSPRRPAGRSQP